LPTAHRKIDLSRSSPNPASSEGIKVVEMKRFASVLGTALGAASMVMTLAIPASASDRYSASANARPNFMCPDTFTCVFSGDDWNGTVWEYSNSTHNGVCYSFASLGITPNPGSITIRGGSTVWIYDAAGNIRQCAYNGQLPLDGNFGYFAINYGIDTCPEPGSHAIPPCS
jgi:hypothetical protein